MPQLRKGYPRSAACCPGPYRAELTAVWMEDPRLRLVSGESVDSALLADGFCPPRGLRDRRMRDRAVAPCGRSDDPDARAAGRPGRTRGADRAPSRAYKMPPPKIVVYVGDTDFGGVHRRGAIMFPARTLMSSSRDMVTAHEMGHYVLGHGYPSTLTPQAKEHEANIEAVRILQVGKGMTEEDALREVLIFLGHLRKDVAAGAPVGRGHANPCEEIRAVVVAYPAQRGWTSKYECAPQGR
jgi:hypothetical protein